MGGKKKKCGIEKKSYDKVVAAVQREYENFSRISDLCLSMSVGQKEREKKKGIFLLEDLGCCSTLNC